MREGRNHHVLAPSSGTSTRHPERNEVLDTLHTEGVTGRRCYTGLESGASWEDTDRPACGLVWVAEWLAQLSTGVLAMPDGNPDRAVWRAAILQA